MIERVTELPELPEGTLGFGPNGWQVGVFEQVTIQRNNLTLQQVMAYVQANHRGILGVGKLQLYLLTEVPEAKGYIVFIPAEVPDDDVS